MHLAASDQSINVHLYFSNYIVFVEHMWSVWQVVTSLPSILTCGLLDDGRILLLQDRTCIVWDLAKEVYFVRELGDHPGPVVMLAINQMNVHMCVCAYVGVGEGVVCTSGCLHMLVCCGCECLWNDGRKVLWSYWAFKQHHITVAQYSFDSIRVHVMVIN